MKKSLSLTLSFALVSSMFASVAFGAEATMDTNAKYEALKAKGIFEGTDGGAAALDAKMTRAQFSKIVTLLKGLSEDASSASVYKDLAGSSWANGFIGAVTKAKYMDGKAVGKFDPTGNVKTEELATVLARVFALPQSTTAVTGNVDAWAKGYVAAAIDAGLITAQADYKTQATRAQLVEATYTVWTKIQAAQTVSAKAEVTGAKKITVTFNGAVDTTKASVKVANGSIALNPKTTTWSEDKKSVTLEYANNLAKAEYTVTVSGVATADLTSKVSVEDEKVSKIDFDSDKASLNRTDSSIVYAGYKVLNQYNEDITSSTTLTATAGKGTAVASNGTVTIDAASNFTLGEQVSVSLLHLGGTYKSAALTVGSTAAVSTINVSQLYQAEKKELQVNGAATSTYYLVLDLKDQYGKSVTDTTYLNNDLLVTVSNPTLVSVNGYNNSTNTATFQNLTIDGKQQVVLQLAGTPTQGGTSTVNIISRTTGNKASFDVVVKQDVKVDTLTLSAPAVAVAGETIEIPFTAVDQFGAAIANPTNTQVISRTAAGTTGVPTFVKDVVKNTTALKLNLSDMTAKGTVFVTIVTGNNKVAQLTINVVDPALASVISGTKDLDMSILKSTGSVTVGTGNVLVKDQYGRDITPTWGTAANNYRVAVDSSTTTVVGQTGTVANGTSTVALSGTDKGSSTITLKLQKNVSGTWTDVANSSYSFAEKVVDKADVASYEATVTGTVYDNNAADYGKEVVVKGVLADGSKVTVPNNASNYVVSTGNGKITFTGGKIVSGGYVTEANKDVEAPVIVSVIGATTSTPITVNVKISNKAPEVAGLELVEGALNLSDKAEGNVISANLSDLDNSSELNAVVKDAVKTTDQYGVEWTNGSEVFSQIVVSNITEGRTIDVASHIQVGDSFNVIAIAGNKTISFKVIVK